MLMNVADARVKAGSSTLEDAGPQPGDVLIVEQRPHRYVLSVVPGDPQICNAKSDPLLALARRFAECHHVDCWFAQDGTATRLGRHRIASDGQETARSVSRVQTDHPRLTAVRTNGIGRSTGGERAVRRAIA